LCLQVVALGPAHPETLAVRHCRAVEAREICSRDISGRHPENGPVYAGDKCLLIPPSSKLSGMFCCLPKEFRNLLSQRRSWIAFYFACGTADPSCVASLGLYVGEQRLLWLKWCRERSHL